MAAPSIARPRSLPRFSGLAWRRARWGYVFIAPWIIGFLAFTLFPMIATFAFTFTNINLAGGAAFVGLKNYETLLNDQTTWDSLAVTAKYGPGPGRRHPAVPRRAAAAVAPPQAGRPVHLLPYVVPFVAGVLIWGGC
jgi:multiple sugar transport system permease protein